jgi:uncharacterized cupin superfamily protein
MTLIPISTAIIPSLDSWGTVADLGSEILEGDCLALGKMVYGAPTDPVSSAYFGATRGVFRMTYPFTEHAVVLEGELTLTNEATEKGTPVLWTITTDRFVKHYVAVA